MIHSPRPNSVLWFERLYGLSIFVSIVDLVIQWDSLFGEDEFEPDTQRILVIFVFFAVFIVFAVQLLLWFYTAHRASRIAKWLLMAIAIISLVSLAVDYTGYEMIELIFYGVSQILAFSGFAFLFRSDARVWFASKGAIPLETDAELDDVFR